MIVHRCNRLIYFECGCGFMLCCNTCGWPIRYHVGFYGGYVYGGALREKCLFSAGNFSRRRPDDYSVEPL